MGLDNHFYSSDRKLKTEKDKVTIKRSQAEYLSHIGSLRKEWEIHEFIAEDYIECGGEGFIYGYGFNNIYYDITHLIPELIQSFSKDSDKHIFPLFRDILYEIAQDKYIIYSEEI